MPLWENAALAPHYGLSSPRNLLLLRFSVACESPLLIFTTRGHVIKIDKECKITWRLHCASAVPDDACVTDDSKFTEFKPRQNYDPRGKYKGISFFESLKSSDTCNFCSWKILLEKKREKCIGFICATDMEITTKKEIIDAIYILINLIASKLDIVLVHLPDCKIKKLYNSITFHLLTLSIYD